MTAMKKVLSPVFQPIMEIGSSRIVHYEALVRSRMVAGGHPQLIGLGERFGFVSAIDFAMLQHALDVLRANPEVSIAVNTSVVTVEQSSNEILSLVFQNMDLARRLIFELTETAPITDMRAIHRFIDAVRVIEARVAFDDYGDGYCRLPNVIECQPEFLKLSEKLVLDLQGSKARIEEAVELVAHYGGAVVGEHVDSGQKLKALCGMGVEYAQGYYVGEPTDHIPLNPQRPMSCSCEKRASVPYGA